MRHGSMAPIAVGATAAVCIVCVRAWQLRWGATSQEAREPLPGDDLIASSRLTATRAITVRAGMERVWPWIAQLGQGRGGLYSYDVLENLVGCDMHSADRIVPEWQHAEVGDAVRLHPQVALTVAALEPGRALVVRGGVPMGSSAPPYDFTWAFVLVARPDGTTRLLIRERYAYTRWWAPLLVEPVEMVSFVMSQKMLRGIRNRAERTAAPATAGTARCREREAGKMWGEHQSAQSVGTAGQRHTGSALTQQSQQLA